MNKITFGRSEDCDIITEDKNKIVSRHHGYLLITEHKTYVVDDNSKNGIYVNGKRIKDKTLLMPQDQVKVANKYPLDWKKYGKIDSDETMLNYDETSRYDSSIAEVLENSHSGPNALIDIPSKMEINQNYAEVNRYGEEGADWKVPLKRNMGDRIGSTVGQTLGCIISILIVVIIIAILVALS